jgi:putative glutamine amidotransferase
MTIRIGLTLCLDTRERWRKQRSYLYGDVLYVRAIERAGGIPIILPMQSNTAALVDQIDGLVIPGGDDFMPTTPYPAEVNFDPTPEAQLEFDTRLLEAALGADRPSLGICYGAQLLARCHGGQLHHHIPADLPDAARHDLPEQAGRHLCSATPGSLLAGILGEAPFSVNSLHHQAIAVPGKGMSASGHAPDGVIEAVESETTHFTLGVQWHPERLEGAPGADIFKALVNACARRQ